ncbi:Putative cyclic-di-GMP phosphodiesterase AdrB [Pandoraea eparura]|jgi:sensor c-di-GMP phosphodiesterase-like protein|uniref:cyclic-guanylate-specific phosphodiesterase n=1 Tax=Pandoraea eparura TaxID=2508291 RepID=A0A5E4TT24_9BURK|nr:EAL domain-containing protein [Pandoraea eparura]VVD90323.1 Putative cyclic-di-GMP phosphodiesterase AdrB [Pandoraea eparura]
MIQHSRVVQWLVTGLVVTVTLLVVLFLGWLRVHHLSQAFLQQEAQRQRAALERIVTTAEDTLKGATPWVGRDCSEVNSSLQATGSLSPYFRSIWLVSHGKMYCSSVIRSNDAIDMPLPTELVPLLTGTREMFVAGTPYVRNAPALALFVPTSATDGVLGFVDGVYLTESLHSVKTAELAWTAMTIGRVSLTSEGPKLESVGIATRGAQVTLDSDHFSTSLAGSPALTRSLIAGQAPVFLAFGGTIALLLGILTFRHLGPAQFMRRKIAVGIKRNEFKVYYQPVMELATGRCAGAEALMRWHHPDAGLVRPDAFIPIAESNGLIIDLTRSLLKQIRNDVARGALPQGFHIAINLAERHLRDTTIVHDIERIYGSLNHTYPMIAEITERYVIRDTAAARNVMAELQRHGIETALDDFGAENNSIGYLKRYDFNYLKIDKEFLPVTEADTVTRNICDSIIHLAERLDMTVVAEGVENEMQANYLRARHVTYAQGYLFARPIAFDELVQFAIAHPIRGLTAVSPVPATVAPLPPRKAS